jgi:hypothetical protein
MPLAEAALALTRRGAMSRAFSAGLTVSVAMPVAAPPWAAVAVSASSWLPGRALGGTLTMTLRVVAGARLVVALLGPRLKLGLESPSPALGRAEVASRLNFVTAAALLAKSRLKGTMNCVPGAATVLAGAAILKSEVPSSTAVSVVEQNVRSPSVAQLNGPTRGAFGATSRVAGSTATRIGPP